MYKIHFTIFFTFAALLCFAQSVDHWETVVFNSDTWHYEIGSSDIPSIWVNPSYDVSQWETGPGGFGYGDEDDNTIITECVSVYLRIDFELVDTSVIHYGILHADYDDGFVAYLNGVEIARSDFFGTVGNPPDFFETADFHEATLYQGGVPEDYLLSGPSFNSLIREGANTLAIQVHNQDISSSDLSSNFFLSLGISDNSMNYNNTPPWFVSPFIDLNFESNLPLIIITTTETDEIYNEPRVPALMGIIDNGAGQTNSTNDPYNGYNGFISIETRGESSQMFPKKNYGFETQLENGENNNVELLGMPEENDWVLHGPYSDKSLLRNVVAYHMGEVTGRYTPRTRLCEVIINDDYQGVYVLTEKIKRDVNRLDIANLRPEDVDGDEVTGGYLFQIDRDNPTVDNDGWYSIHPNYNFYAFDDPEHDELVIQQKTYIQNFFINFENTMNANDYVSNYEDFVNVDSWIDYFLITELGKHIDAYKYSFYMYKTKDSNGGKLNFGPIWDFNLAFGNFDFGCSPNPPGWAYDFEGTCHEAIPFWVKRLINIPQVQHKINCRWTELREGPLHLDSLIQFIDNKVVEIGDAEQRNFERWPVLGQYVWPNDYIGNTYEDEVEYLKYWISQRLNWMDLVMLGDCNLVLSNEENDQTSRFNIYPNPASDQLSIEVSNLNTPTSSIHVYDMLGNLIQSAIISDGTNQINISTLSNGMFLYHILDGKSMIQQGKFVKSN